MNNLINFTPIGVTSQSQYYHNTLANSTPQQTSIIRQTTEEAMNEVLSNLLQTEDDTQSHEELRRRKFTHENTHSSSTVAPITRQTTNEMINDLLPDLIDTQDDVQPAKKKQKKRKSLKMETPVDLTDSSNIKELAEQRRKENNRQTAIDSRDRQQNYIQKLEKATYETLSLGKELNDTISPFFNIPPLENGNSGSSSQSKQRYERSATERHYALVKKTHDWIKSTMMLMAKEVFDTKTDCYNSKIKALMLENRVKELDIENTWLRMQQTTQQPLIVNPPATRVSPDGTND